MSQVFISYARDQAAGQRLARELNSVLRRRQIATFFDEDGIQPGARWLEALKTAVAGSQLMLWVVSGASHDRPWQEREFNAATQQGVPIIPVLAEDIALPMQLNDTQAVFLFGERKAAQLDQLLTRIEQVLGIDRLRPLIKAALKAKQNEAYEQAMGNWRQVLALEPEHARAQSELAALAQLQAQVQQGQAYLGQLVLRMAEISPVFNQAAQALNGAGKHPDTPAVLAQTQAFLENRLSAVDYMQWWRSAPASLPPVGMSNTTNYAAFAQRVVRGEVALFIGSELAREYRQPVQNEQALAQQLAASADFAGFQGSLSGIAEYYRLNKDYGESRLLAALRESLATQAQNLHLYQLLAQVAEPLILVSSAYDDTLEQCFDARQKPYVELTSLVNRGQEHDIGHLVVRYSDRDKPEVYQPIEEEISRFRWYEEGYSLIFKIRGTCGSARPEHAYQRDALTLAESDYFTFARYAENMIPAYLARQLRDRVLLFVGFSPKSWEERLLANALLARREKIHPKQGSAFTVGVANDPLEAAYWMEKKVQQHDLDMQKLGEYLEEALL